ncbi:NACHT, LRR and PYD domains-containing protein 12-like, partial [Engraulis encrasicolus]|uniref:NACHT, LRR and PYD domains-containing protein 12-like n=1 Tax=Engraulis encrasicolus TaxID=184585 RepID=UPI002FD5BF19
TLVTEPASVDVLLTNLIKGNLLPFALHCITTRPAAATRIPHECVDLVTEIRGFNDPQKEEYFRKRISDENLANRTIIHLMSSRSLNIMCHIPLVCWILSTVVERTTEISEKETFPRTLTQIYSHFLNIQASVQKTKFSGRQEQDDEIFVKLGKLAFQQLEKGNLIFYEEDLAKADIDVKEASVYSGVCTQIFRAERGSVFSFVHLSIQEFLAALHVLLSLRNREKSRNMSDPQITSQLSALFTAETLHELHRIAVDLALQNKNGYLDLFLRFLLGLSVESNQSLLKRLVPQIGSQSQISEQTVQYIKERIRAESESVQRINLFYCLNELNQHAVVEHTDRNSGVLSIEMLLQGQWETEMFKFRMSEEQLEEFDLHQYMQTPEQDQTELLSPDDVLRKLVPVVTTSTSAELPKCYLSENSCSHLASVLNSPSSCLRHLDVSYNELLDSGVKLLCCGLQHQHCRLETLNLSVCYLTQKSCSFLACALAHSSCLTLLDLSNNRLHDSGVELLCAGLQCPNCNLKTLKLWSCNLSEESCSYLASVLTSPSTCLTLLDLRNNGLHDSGVERLASGLQHEICKLESLCLSKCNLTEKSCSYLASVLTSHSSCLTLLNLSDNALLDSGVELLCSGLLHHNVKLEQL